LEEKSGTVSRVWAPPKRVQERRHTEPVGKGAEKCMAKECSFVEQ